MFSSFMLNTWIVATLVALTAGLIGFFVVLRGATFAAHALPVGTFPGAAAASLLGINALWGLAAFAGLGVAGIAGLARHQRNEVATALTLIALLGLGTLFLSLSTEYSQAVYALLFGEVLGVAHNEIAPVALLSLAVDALVLLMFRPLVLSAISGDLVVSRRLTAPRLNLLFLAVLGLATAMALPVVGALLVFSLTVGPPSAARAFTADPVRALLLSAAFAVLTVWAAIALSYVTNWPIGFFVGGLAAFAYVVGRAVSK